MIAILSDIHGNLPALEAVLADLPPVREIWLLGDLLGELPYPRAMMDRLLALERELPVAAVAGNREVSLLEVRDGLHEDWRKGTQLSALTWTADQLEPRHWEWIAALPKTRETLGGKALLFHGTPEAVRGTVENAEQARGLAARHPQTRFFGGHTHCSLRYAWPGGLWVNAGSVGVSLEGRGGVAVYALLEEDGPEPEITFRHVSYPAETVVRALHESGMTERAPGITRALILELRTGRHRMYSLIAFARCYAQERLGRAVDAIPPDLWAEAEQLWDGSPWTPEDG